MKRKELINRSFITEYSVILIANFEVRRAEMVRKYDLIKISLHIKRNFKKTKSILTKRSPHEVLF